MPAWKKYLVAFLVLMSLLMTGFGGLRNMISSSWQLTSEHSWNDGMYLLGLAILVAVLPHNL
jgi:hypothetical protein